MSAKSSLSERFGFFRRKKSPAIPDANEKDAKTNKNEKTRSHSFSESPRNWVDLRSQCCEYTVQNGDTVSSLSVKFGVTPHQLATLNRWLGPTHLVQLHPGTILFVPCTDSLFEDGGGGGVGIGLPVPHSEPYNSEPQFSPTDRPAPGMATRLSPEIIFQNRHYDDPTDEIKERGFVKVPSKRIYPSTKIEYNGTIIVTPDFFIFEPDEIYNNLNDNEGRQSNNEKTKESSSQPPHEAAVCVELSKIEAMNTHSSLLELQTERSTLSVEETKDNKKENEQDLVKLNVNKEEEDIIEIIVDDQIDEKTENPLNSTEIDTSECPIEQPPPPTTSVQRNDSIELRSLYLCIRCVLDEEKDKQHKTLAMFFAISELEMDEVFASMLQWGVGQSVTKSTNKRHLDGEQWEVLSSGISSLYTDALSDLEDWESYDYILGEKKPKKRQKDRPKKVSQNNCNKIPIRNSMVEEALKELAEEKYRPILFGASSDILTEAMLDDLSSGLPAHLIGYNLHLVYSTSRDGFSLLSIYRKMRDVNVPSILFIQDSTQGVFGALLSDKMRLSQYYYGKGETFVFHWAPIFKKFEWTGKNNFLLKGDSSYFSIGATSGHNAIWFEDNLKNGRSETTETFDNPPLCGGNSSDFTIDCLEVWQFAN